MLSFVKCGRTLAFRALCLRNIKGISAGLSGHVKSARIIFAQTFASVVLDWDWTDAKGVDSGRLFRSFRLNSSNRQTFRRSGPLTHDEVL